MMDKNPVIKKVTLPKKARDELRVESIRKTMAVEKPKVSLPRFSWDKDEAK